MHELRSTEDDSRISITSQHAGVRVEDGSGRQEGKDTRRVIGPQLGGGGGARSSRAGELGDPNWGPTSGWGEGGGGVVQSTYGLHLMEHFLDSGSNG